MRKPFEGLSGHGSSSGRRAEPETELAFTRRGKDGVFLKYPSWLLKFSFIAITKF
ncbi:MAG: hypothetical protein M1308_21480 [Actinobacteria bacterium]|nr:hypothetical protein [Actinomycetota bacterium]